MYRHTQTSLWTILTFGGLAIALFILGFRFPPVYPSFITAGALIVALFFFGTLTIVADDDKLSFHFGIGLIGRHFKYDAIGSVKRVKNKWNYGWGIRWYGPGWLYNVAGLDAVELTLRNGKKLRIGTDEPDALIRFVEPRLKKDN